MQKIKRNRLRIKNIFRNSDEHISLDHGVVIPKENEDKITCKSRWEDGY